MIEIGPADDFEPGDARRLDLVPPVAVFRTDDGDFYAIDDTCSHQDASLSTGWLEGCKVECPLHASCFDLRTGQVDGPPAKVGVRTHRIVVADGVVYVDVATEAPPADPALVEAAAVAGIA